VRPPGHHAGVNGLLEGGESCGFCIFNNVAAGALYAISEDRQLCKRCAIVDIDVHHGNGTEEIVKRCHDPDKLFFFSIHLYDNDKKKRSGNNQYKFYHGTGSQDDLALNIINVPIIPLWKDSSQPSLAPRQHNTRGKTRSQDSTQDESSEAETPRDSGSKVSDGGSESGSTQAAQSSPPTSSSAFTGRLAYRQAILNRLLPSLRAFNPDLILISAGFDAAKGDVGNARHEMGGERIGLDLEPEDYAWTTRKILEVADICCQGRAVSVLEGGYGRTSSVPGASLGGLDRTMFSECAIRHLHAMIDPYDTEKRFS
jgi:acetoin utilization deacetylase AcuC-like enzyme